VDTLLKQVHEQEQVLKDKEDKLRTIGEKYGVNFDPTDEEKKHQEA